MYYHRTVSTCSLYRHILADSVASGIYVPDDDRWPAKFRGIGIRIEDSVCVGDDNPIILTTEAVKEVSCFSLEWWLFDCRGWSERC